MTKYDISIIGSGLGGLLCGSLLSKEGYNVVILEKNPQLGGCLQTFKRDGVIFDTGVHYIGGMDEGQNLNTFFKFFGIMDKLKLKRMDENGFDQILFKGDNKVYKYAMGYENFENTLMEDFPKEKDSIKNYTKKIKEICSEFPLYNLKGENAYFLNSDIFSQGTVDCINRITKNQKLANILGAMNLLYAGVADKSPVYLHALILNSYIESSWRLIDGGSQISDLLVESIKGNGGTLLNKSEVVKLNIENNEVQSVKLKDGRIIESKVTISNTHPTGTLKMIDEDKIRMIYRNRINSIENTVSVFTLYIVLKKNSFSYLNYNIYYFNKENVWNGADYDESSWPKGYFMLTPPTSHSDKYADGMIVCCYMKWEDTLKWERTFIGKRGDDYKEFKRQKAEKVIDNLEINFPDIRSKIHKYYTSSPLTYRDYTATKEGSMYGILKNAQDPIKSHIPVRTKISNLYFTGQNTNMHGVLGVTIGSILTCAGLLGLDYLFEKIKKFI